MEPPLRDVARGGGAQAIERGAALLVAVIGSDRPLSVADLAHRTGLPKSTISRTVSALVRSELLERLGPRGPVRPGSVLHRYASRGGGRRSLAELARGPMERLAEASGETVGLALPAPSGVETVAQIDSPHILGGGQWVGRTVDYHCTAAGKVFLALGTVPMPASLPAVTPKTITDDVELGAQLERIRHDGWAAMRDELEVGLSAIAAPVDDGNGRTIAALTISGPSIRVTKARCAELAPIVIAQAQRLGQLLGSRGDSRDEAVENVFSRPPRETHADRRVDRQR